MKAHFETYIRYSGFDHEDLKRPQLFLVVVFKLILDILDLMVNSEKKVLGLLKVSFLRRFFGGGDRFFISLKGAF